MQYNQIEIRKERPEEYRAVETLVRESFWNVYHPGAMEHYVLHRYREDPAFVKELDLVMLCDGELIGQNMFVRAEVQADDGRTVPILTMGPICIANSLKRRGYGKMLLDESLRRAAALGFGAVCFEGSIAFYSHCGFTYASEFGLRYHDLPEGADASFFLARELIPGALSGVTGVYTPPKGYFVCQEEPEAFAAYEEAFPRMERLILPTQLKER